MGKEMVSNFCANKLCEYLVDIDDDVERFLFHADACINRVREESRAERENMTQAQKRMDGLKQAFAKLTDQDKEDLNFTAEIATLSKSGSIVKDLEQMMQKEYVPLCESIEKALYHPALSRHKSPTQKTFTEFARKAVNEGWVDISTNNNGLIALLLILMEETGVKHDADSIARDAMRDPLRLVKS